VTNVCCFASLDLEEPGTHSCLATLRALHLLNYQGESFMNTFRSATVLGFCALLATTAAGAGQSSPPSSSPDPAAASSPHQRSVTGSDGPEAPAEGSAGPGAASSPHQQDAMHGNQNHHGMAADHDGADPTTFVTKAAQGGMTEVALSKAAATKSSDPSVKKYADQMVQDHQKANDELSAIAKKKGLNVPASLDAEHQAVVQKINNKSGGEFDQAYGKQMAMDHAKTVALFEGATQSTDTDLAAFAKKTLPTLKEHKQMAAKLPGAVHSAGIGESAKGTDKM
jgi:putative membrane protein